MANSSLNKRVSTLEAELAALKESLGSTAYRNRQWLDSIWGKFADDPAFEEAMRLGREWRESFRPKPRVKRMPVK